MTIKIEDLRKMKIPDLKLAAMSLRLSAYGIESEGARAAVLNQATMLQCIAELKRNVAELKRRKK